MPVGSICLPVSHLPSACSFYLEILQSLNYRFVQEKEGKIGFGPDGNADLFLCQREDESPTVANISFTAPSAIAIDSFAAAASRAGGSVLTKPTLKDCEFGTYSSTVLDLDGNKITATCDDSSMSTASYPMSTVTSRRSDEGGASGQTDGPWRITVRSQTSVPPPAPSEAQASGDSTANALVGTLLGVAAGAAITYLVGKERKSNEPPSKPASMVSQARQTHALPYQAPRQIEYPFSPRSSSSVPESHNGDYFAAKPRLLRSVTYHYEYSSMPPSPEPSPPNQHCLARSYAAPSVSEVSGSAASGSRRHGPLMIEAPPSSVGTLPPSPPSSISSRSHGSRRTESPSLVPSSHSKAPSRRSHSVASSQRTIRPEHIPLPASVAASRVSAPRSVASSHHSKQPHASTRGTSEASWHSAEQVPSSRKTSTVSRSPADVPIPDSRKTSVVSRRPVDIALPISRKTSVVSRRPEDVALPESCKTSSASRSPAEFLLPESRRTSTVSRDSFRTSTSKQPHDYVLPASRQTSVAPHDIELPASEAGSRASHSTLKARQASSTTSRQPENYPLPQSRTTSVASHIPEDVPLPRSEVGSRVSGMSTLKPPNPTASALNFQKDDDTESLAPSDSISQISVRKHRKKHHSHHHGKDSESGSRHSSHKEGKKRSIVSMPEREAKKEKEKRSAATLLGF